MNSFARSLALLATAFALAAAHAQTRLPDLGAGGVANEINDQNVVVGFVVDPLTHYYVPAKWTNGQVSVLSTGSFTQAIATRVSNTGWVAGYADDIFLTPGGTPVRWNPAGEIEVLRDFGFGGRANGINDQGVTVGTVYRADHTSQAVRWLPDGTMQLLTDEQGVEVPSQANGINNEGHIAGSLLVREHVYAATKWGVSGPTPFDEVQPMLQGATGIASNNTLLIEALDVVNWRWFSLIQRPNGERVNLEYIVHDLRPTASDLNSSENVVGYGSVPNENDPFRLRALMWLNGVPRELPMVEQRDLFSFAIGVNESGYAVGSIQNQATHEFYPVIWDPIDGAGLILQMRPARGYPGQTVTLMATYLQGGAPVANREVRFLMNANTPVGTARTNRAGVAVLSYRIPNNAPARSGDYMTSLGGSRYWRTNMTILAIPTQVTATGAEGTRGTVVPLVANLRNRLTGLPAADQTLRFHINNRIVGVRTDAQGRAQLNWLIPSTARAGQSFPLRVEFPGNANHASHSASVSVRVR